MLGRSQIAVLSVVALLAGTSVFAHFHHNKSGPKPVTAKVTSPAPLEFKPFQQFGAQPRDWWYVPEGWQPKEFGRIAIRSERERKHTRCWRKLNRPNKRGLAECGGLITIWI